MVRDDDCCSFFVDISNKSLLSALNTNKLRRKRDGKLYTI